MAKGKRVIPGNRQKKRGTVSRSAGKSKRKQKKARGMPWVLLAAVPVGAMAVLCALGARTDRILPRTTVLGENLGGLNWQQAQERIAALAAEDGARRTVTVTAGEDSVTLSGADYIRINAEGAAEKALAWGRSEGLMQGGISYLRALLVPAEVDVSEYVEFANLDTVLDRLNEAVAQVGQAAIPTEYRLTDTEIVFTKGVSGNAVAEDELKTAVLTALSSGAKETVIPCPMTVVEPETFDMSAVYQAVYAEPKNAEWNPDGSVSDSVDGVSFDEAAAETALSAAGEGETVPVPLTRTPAEVSTEELKQLLFRDKLGSASSEVGGSSARKSNVALVAEYIDGTILAPGETFSYNDTVGNRTEERGFKAAPSYVSGQTVDTVGGGVCQGSSTLYLASIRADMKVVERHSHSFICSYMPYGEDAAVAWGALDYRFTNNTDYPVKISMSYSGGTLTAALYGTNLTGEYVKITNEVTSTSEYKTVYEDTTELSPGETKTKTSGYNGMNVTVYRSRYDADGTLISKEVENTTAYRVRNRVILRGVKKESEKPTEAPQTESPAASERPTEEITQ